MSARDDGSMQENDSRASDRGEAGQAVARVMAATIAMLPALPEGALAPVLGVGLGDYARIRVAQQGAGRDPAAHAAVREAEGLDDESWSRVDAEWRLRMDAERAVDRVAAATIAVRFELLMTELRVAR